jgi:hypothetical protein
LPDLKAVLELSDAQIQSLGQLAAKGQAVQPLAQRIQQSPQQPTLLQGSSPTLPPPTADHRDSTLDDRFSKSLPATSSRR